MTGDEGSGSESVLEIFSDDDRSDIGSQLKNPTGQLVIGRTMHLNPDRT
jgi:hypothetical protein